MTALSDLKLWTKFSLTLEFKTPCVGGVPNARNLIEGWLKTKNIAKSEEELTKLVDATIADVGGVVEERASSMWTVFKRREYKGVESIYIEGRQVKSLLKEASNILREMLIKNAGGKSAKSEDGTRNRFTNLKSRVAERLFVEEDEIYFLRDGALLSKADSTFERAIHVQTAMGPRSALKRADCVHAGAQVKFTLKMLNDGVVDEELLRVLFEFAGDNGLGSDRSQGSGKFKLVEMKKLDT